MPEINDTITISRNDLASLVGEGFHTAFRKSTDHPSAHAIWVLIKDMPNEEYGGIINFVMLGIRGDGKEIKP